ncbi:alpha-amylase family glycosyl hydrolase [Danxiaibacter flavus]|uniref:Alpha-amylase family glycosyl hydrolase n=1 Tax=Danxiaibacter flavus TaxID=3049108 RepID=A0ABV3ZD85_9BACT|nr:alpha-amylase family glycosyl hydrolase [Chitinophagaceae bacterium DXS]
MSIKFETIDWAYGSNIYEVNTRQYTAEGTFSAFQQHLPRLRDMGIEILWFMPVTPISKEKRLGTRGSYYACSDYTSINPEYGTLEDFKTLVSAAHDLGFKVIIDWVANHTGYDHHWTKEHSEWYRKDADGNFVELNGWDDVIDLDYTNAALRREMIKCMQFWVEKCNIDGFRCDMAHLVPLDFWKEARKACEETRPLFWLAECDEEKYLEVFDVSYAWKWMHATEKFMRNEIGLGDINNILHGYANYHAKGWKLFFTANHDENTWNGTESEKYGPAAKAFAIFSVTWPGLPLIYSGQELPNNKRLKFFEKDVIEWHEPVELHVFYKTLLQLRRENSALHNEARMVWFSTDADDKILAYLLVKDHQKVLVILNLSGAERVKIDLADASLKGGYINLFSGLQHHLNEREIFELQPWEYFVYASV